jgi:phthiocerol/phenolphthiocerol synthesis type-I polyketide synthase C
MREESIAIIGIGCRFPGAEDPQAFWRLLREGGDAVTCAPEGRDYSPADRAHAAVAACGVRRGGFLKQVDQFDPDFFKISPREAARIDPQQRLMLEVAWEALEDAGLSADALAGSRTGVFVGVMNEEYAHVQLRRLDLVDALLGVGSAAGVTANRLSYTFDLRGPSTTLNTLCSSSLVALHLACRSLREGESSPVALAGGVNVILRPAMDIFYAKSGLLAADGRCKTFDERADVLVRGEGAGVIVLKPLAAALADGDRVHAVIRGSAVNHDGRSNGITAPSRWGQVAVMSEAYRDAGVEPGRVQYVEAHGTGTPLSDAIELSALGDVLGAGRPGASPCRVGSVKPNLGHLESASGMASIIKVALMLSHRELVPTINFDRPHPYLRLETLPLSVQRAREPWPVEGDGPALAGVNSFGLTGTNAHVVLEEPPRAEPATLARGEERRDCVLPLSAHAPEVLRRLAEACADVLDGEPAPALEDFCHTAALRRSHHDYRLALVAGSHDEAAEALRAFARGEERPRLFQGRRSGKRLAAAHADADAETLAELYAQGGNVAWGELYGSRGKFVPLPTYPFRRARYWLEDEESEEVAQPSALTPEAVLAARDDAERLRLLETYLREQIAAVLGFAPSQLDPELPLSHLGLDSLLAVEIKQNVEVGLGTALPLALLLQDANVVVLARALSERLAGAKTAPAAGAGHAAASAAVGADPALLLERLEELSDEEVEMLLGSMSNEEGE